MHIEDIVDMHNVDNTLTDSGRYNASIWYNYTAWVIKIFLDNLIEVNYCFTWTKCFTQGFHKLSEAGKIKYVLVIWCNNGMTF